MNVLQCSCTFIVTEAPPTLTTQQEHLTYITLQVRKSFGSMLQPINGNSLLLLRNVVYLFKINVWVVL